MRSLAHGPSWNRSSVVDGNLPDALLTDIRFATVPEQVRSTLIREYALTLPSADNVAAAASMTEEEEAKRLDRDKRDEAVRRRNEHVEERKRDQRKELQYGQRRLEAEERELQRAQRVGMAGLMANLRT